MGDSPKPISSKIGSTAGIAWRIVPGLLIALACTAIVAFIFAPPTIAILHARTWTPTPCRITDSGIDQHRGSKDTTYRVRVAYDYHVNNQTYHGSRYAFLSSYSSGYEGKSLIVKQLRRGTRTTCYVDPSDPTQSVLIRSFTGDMWIGLVPVGFAIIGILAAISGWRKVRNLRRTWLPTPKPSALMRPASPRWVTPFFWVFAALIVNGAMGLFLKIFVVDPWRARTGLLDTGFTVFHAAMLAPGILFALVFIVAVIQTIWSFIVEPRTELRMSKASLTPGDQTDISWKLVGRSTRIKRLKIVAEGREEASYGRGGQNTVRSLFAQITLIDTTEPTQIAQGRAVLQIPPDTMHSLSLLNDRIAWEIKVAGTIENVSPGLEGKYPFVVQPAPVTTPTTLPSPANPGSGLDIRLAKYAYHPGEEIAGSAFWEHAGTLDLRIFFYTAGRGDRDVWVVHRELWKESTGPASKEFRFRLPNGPYSCSGELVSVRWGIELVAGKNKFIGVEFTLSSTDQPVILKPQT